MESAHTGQVGKSQPRGSGLDATVDRTSATAAIVTSLRSEPQLNLHYDYRPISLTMSQHHCVRLTISDSQSVLRCSEFLTEAFALAQRPTRLLSREHQPISGTHPSRDSLWRF